MEMCVCVRVRLNRVQIHTCALFFHFLNITRHGGFLFFFEIYNVRNILYMYAYKSDKEEQSADIMSLQ